MTFAVCPACREPKAVVRKWRTAVYPTPVDLVRTHEHGGRPCPGSRTVVTPDGPMTTPRNRTAS